jgi:hypothetical protein
VWIGYRFISQNPDAVALAHRMEAKSLEGYQLCAQGVGLGSRDRAGLMQCEVAYRKSIGGIPTVGFHLVIGPRGATEELGTLPSSVAADPSFDRNFSHLQTDDKFWATGLSAAPDLMSPGSCSLRAADDSHVAAPFAACEALREYFSARILVPALYRHDDAALTLLRQGIRPKGERWPLAVALRTGGLTRRYAQAVLEASDAGDVQTAAKRLLLAELARPAKISQVPRAALLPPCAIQSPDGSCREYVDLHGAPYLGAVRALVELGAPLGAQSADGDSLITLAVADNAPDVVRYLLAQPFDWRERQVLGGAGNRVRAMTYAIATGSSENLKALLDAGWNVNESLSGISASDWCLSCTPLEYAVGLAPLIPYAQQSASDVQTRSSPNGTIVDLLLARGASVHADGDYLLFLAMYNRSIFTRGSDGFTHLVDVLIRHGARADVRKPCPLPGNKSAPCGLLRFVDPSETRLATLLRSHGASR